jgi:trehalose 6-phosphate synthase/phosphatase
MERPFIADPRLSGRGDKFRGGLIVASNREPCSHRKTARGLKPEVPAGGLVSALDTVLRVTGGTWVAWGSGSGDREGADAAGRLWVPQQRPAYILRRVWLSPKGVENYYRGFCNLVLWPLFHGEGERIIYKEPFWDEYERSNRLFAEAILEEAGMDATIWVHDYHLCLVPRILREAEPERTVAHFWHIPWPDLQQFDLLPHGEEIIAGLLANDLIGFQIPLYARNFMECAAACLGATVDYDDMTLTWQGRVTRVRAFPISTDFNRLDALAGSALTTARAGRIREKYRLPRLVGLAVDRLDYTKGILQRLMAIELFFLRNRRFRGAFTFIQVAVMTRHGGPYVRYLREVEELIERINGLFGKDDWQPVIFLKKKIEQRKLVSWYRLADLAVITPIRDGMNLVAKEYVAARGDGEGVLILGREAGAANELIESIIVDPRDTEAFAAAIHRALTMPRRERQERMARLRERVEKNTIYHWVGAILDELALLPVTKRGGRHALRHWEEIAARLAGRGLFICLDFDGTLAPIVEKPELATMPDDIRTILLELKERYPVAVISGRSLEDLRGRAALPGIICLGNHGAEMEGGTFGVSCRSSLEDFLSAARRLFASIPGIQIEDKGVTASIHFRRVAPLLLGDFFVAFKGIGRKFAEKVSVSEGRKVFEVRPRGAAGKGDAMGRLMAGVGKDRVPLYMGDDTSDEEAFRALRGAGISVAVGGSPEADYYLKNQGEVHTFLELLARIYLPGEEQNRGTDNGKGARQ